MTGQEQNPEHWIIMRQVVLGTQENIAAGISMARKAGKVVDRIYMEGGRTLSLHVPPEDLEFQKKMDASSTNPVLVTMLTPDGMPVCGFPAHPLPCFSHLNELVWPLFTSDNRLHHFASVLQENLYRIPECSFSLFRFDTHLRKKIAEGFAVINPVPELFLSGVFPVYDKERDQVIVMTPTPELDKIAARIRWCPSRRIRRGSTGTRTRSGIRSSM